MTLPYNVNLLDVVLLSVMALFALRGAVRGFLEEVTGLVGILAGIWLAGRYYGELGRIFATYTKSDWVYVIAYVLLLCLAMFVISMVSRGMHRFLKLAYADWINHLAGALIGGLKGLALCGVMVFLLGYFLSDAGFMRGSKVAPFIQEVIAYARTMLPTHGLAQ